MTTIYDLNEALEEAGEVPCQNAPEMFFPEKNPQFNHLKYALNQCQKCPIIDTCLAYALDANETFGIWGGMTFTQRREIRSRERRASLQQPA